MTETSINRSVEYSCHVLHSIMKDPFLQNNPNCQSLNEEMKESLESLKQCSKMSDKEGITGKAIAILQQIDQSIDSGDTHLNEKKISAIHTKLKCAQEMLLAASTEEIQPIRPEIAPIDMYLAFLCDVDCPDHNGAINGRIPQMLYSGIPFVTTSSLLCARGNTPDSEENQLMNESVLLRYSPSWSIYRSTTPGGKNFLVFIPKASASEDESRELLAAYDFNSDNLEKISVLEALIPQDKVDFTAFPKLFTANPSKNKLVYIAGHGGVGNPAGLTASNYEMLLQVLDEQKCRGMTESSCYSGGESTLLHVDKAKATYEKQKEADIAGKPAEPSTLKFPVIMRSIGDFVSYSEKTENFKSYFSELESFLESGRGETVAGMRSTIRKAGGARESKSDESLAQVFYPSGADSPAGFRPIGEKGESFSLTFVRLQQEKLLAKQLASKTDSIVVDNKKYLEIHPLVVETPLLFQKENPILLSLIPGTAHHYLKSVQLAVGSIEDFLKKNAKFYQDAEVGVSKGFYMAKLHSATGEKWEQAALCFEKEKLTCLYFQNGKYWRWIVGVTPPQPISQGQYALALEAWDDATRPSDSAISSQMGGQQDQNIFQKAFTENDDINKLRERFRLETVTKKEAEISAKLRTPDGFIDQQELKNTVIDSLLNGIDDTQDRESVVFQLLSINRPDLAQAVIERCTLSPNMQDLNGMPLVMAAAKADARELTNYLLKQGASPVTKDPISGNTLLHMAVENRNTSLILELLRMGGNLEAKNNLGNTAIFSTIMTKDIETFLFLKDIGANIDARNRAGHSLLGNALWYRENRSASINLATITKFLDAGIDSNGGNPSPLQIATKNSDREVIEMLLEKGATLTSSVIVEAMRNCSPEVVEKLLQRPDAALDAALTVAVELANSNYVKTLLQKGAKLHPTYNSKQYERGFERMEAAKDYSIIEALLKQGATPDFEFAVFEIFAEKNLDLIREWLDQGILKTSESLLSFALRYVERFRPLLRKLISGSVVLNNINQGTYKRFFDEIIAIGDFELVQLALANGAQVTDTNVDFIKTTPSPLTIAAKAIRNGTDPEGKIYKLFVEEHQQNQNECEKHSCFATPFAALVASGNLDLIEWAIAHGAQPQLATEGTEITPLQAAEVLADDAEGKILKRFIDMGVRISQEEDENENIIGPKLAYRGFDDIGAEFWKKIVDNNNLEKFQKTIRLGWITENAILEITKASVLQNNALFCRELEKNGFVVGCEKCPVIPPLFWSKLSGETLEYFLSKIQRHPRRQTIVKICLEAAVNNRNLADIKILIDNGANINEPGIFFLKDYPVFEAISNKNLPLLELLIEHNVNLSVISKNNQDVLTTAKATGDPTIVACVTAALAKR